MVTSTLAAQPTISPKPPRSQFATTTIYELSDALATIRDYEFPVKVTDTTTAYFSNERHGVQSLFVGRDFLTDLVKAYASSN